MSDLTRRGFVRNSAATTAGMTAIGALLTQQAAAEPAPASDSVVAYIKDPTSGDISVMVGDREVRVNDPKLAARIANAAR